MTLAYATLEDFERYVSGAEVLLDEETGGYWTSSDPENQPFQNGYTGEILFWDELKKLPVKGIALGKYHEVIAILGRN